MPGIADVAKGSGLKIDAVADVFEEILARVSRGEPVRIKGFGTFERRKFPGRTLKTPLVPGGSVTYPDAFAVRFRQSVLAKQRMNSKASKAAAASQPAAKGKAPKAESKSESKPKTGMPPAAKASKPSPKSEPPAEAPKAKKAEKRKKREE